MNWGVALAVAAAAVLGLFWLMKPNLGRIGVGYARSRPKQAALLVGGLMIATTVIAAAGIASDSAGRSFSESLLGTIHVTDVIFDARHSSRGAVDVDAIEAMASDSRLNGVETIAPGYYHRFGVEASSGAGDNNHVFMGIDPASWSKVGRWDATSGIVPNSLPAWAAGAVLNDAAAKNLRVGPGDEIYLLLGGETLLERQESTFDGHFTLYFDNFAQPIAVEGENDASAFEYYQKAAVPRATLIVEVAGPSDTYFGLTVTGPSGTVYTAPAWPGGNKLFVDPDAEYFGRGSLYGIEVHSPQAVNVDFTVTVSEAVQTVREADVEAVPVLGIVEGQGSNPLGGSPTIFMSLPAINELIGTENKANVAILDFADGVDLTGRTQSFEDASRAAWSSGGVRVSNVRENLDRDVRDVELAVRFTFLGIGSFSILAGFMLIGVMMALLVEERKGILAATRALGAQRAHVTQMLAHEGSVYAGLAGGVGLIGAVILALYLSGPLTKIFADEGSVFVLVFKPGTVLAAAGMGFFLTLAVIAIAAQRAGRFHIAAALRSSEEEPRSGRIRRRVAQALLLGGGLLFTFLGALGNATGLVLGPCLVALGIGALIGNKGSTYAIIGAALTAYLLASFWFLEVNDEFEFLLYPVRGVLLSMSLAIVAAYSGWLHALLTRATARIKRAGPFVETALGHIRQRPGRAALTISMFATVLVVLTALGTLFATFEPNDMGNAGGYDVIGDSSVRFDDAQAYLAANPSVSGIDPFAHADAWITTPWSGHMISDLQIEYEPNRYYRAYMPVGTSHASSGIGVTPEFAATTTFAGDALSGSVANAFKQVMSDPTKIIVSKGAQMYEGGDSSPIRLGETYQLRNFGDVQVIALLEDARAAGVYANEAVFESLSAQSAVGTRVWVETSADHQIVVEELEAGFRRAGMEAASRENVNPGQAAISGAFQTMISVFLGLGILIGMVSLALIMGRNVMLRRAEIGTFRALGAGSRDILAMFTLEALYLAGFAIAIGLGVGLLLAKSMVSIDAIYVPLKVDWGALAGLYAFTLVAAGLAAFIPALRASRLSVATSVRHSE